MWKRHQSIVYELSKDSCVDKVIFINPEVWIKDNLKISKISQVLNQLSENGAMIDNVSVYTPISFFPEFLLYGVLRKFKYYFTISKFVRVLRQGPFICIINNPYVYAKECFRSIIDSADLVIFDLSDDYSEFYAGDQQKKMDVLLSEVLQRSDMILAVNEHLKNKYSCFNSNIQVVTNATNYDNFALTSYANVEVLDDIKARFDHIVGYSGWINDVRIDTKILDSFTTSKNIAYVFVGPVSNVIRDTYSSDNVFFIQAVPYSELPNYIHYFDVAIIPFLINGHTKGNDLLKIHDYHAVGKPVVSTRIGGVDRFENLIYIASDTAAFTDSIRKAIAEDSDEKIRSRQLSAFANSWRSRIKQVKKAINKLYFVKTSGTVFDEPNV